jgi:hypothetical protein
LCIRYYMEGYGLLETVSKFQSAHPAIVLATAFACVE